MGYDAYTENIADFGYRERKMAAELLAADLPDDFGRSGIRLALNRDSGYVFLVDEDYRVAMINPESDECEIFHTSPYEGLEGFADELAEQYGDMHSMDQEWARDIGIVDEDELADV